jgi:hypothetical protein
MFISTQAARVYVIAEFGQPLKMPLELHGKPWSDFPLLNFNILSAEALVINVHMWEA